MQPRSLTIGVGVEVVSLALQFLWPQMPKILALMLFLVGLVLIIFGIWPYAQRAYQRTGTRADMGPFLAILSVVLIGSGLATAYLAYGLMTVQKNKTITSVNSGHSSSSAAPNKPSARYYSKSDKERIAEALYELKEALNKKVKPVYHKASEVWQLWNQRQQSPDSGKPLKTAETIAMLKEIELEYEDAVKTIYVKLVEEYRSYNEVLEIAVADSDSKPIYDLLEKLRRLVHELRAVGDLYEAAPQKSDEIAKLAMVAVQVFASANTKVNKWADESLKRIEQQERILLSKD